MLVVVTTQRSDLQHEEGPLFLIQFAYVAHHLCLHPDRLGHCQIRQGKKAAPRFDFQTRRLPRKCAGQLRWTFRNPCHHLELHRCLPPKPRATALTSVFDMHLLLEEISPLRSRSPDSYPGAISAPRGETPLSIAHRQHRTAPSIYHTAPFDPSKRTKMASMTRIRARARRTGALPSAPQTAVHQRHLQRCCRNAFLSFPASEPATEKEKRKAFISSIPHAAKREANDSSRKKNKSQYYLKIYIYFLCICIANS